MVFPKLIGRVRSGYGSLLFVQCCSLISDLGRWSMLTIVGTNQGKQNMSYEKTATTARPDFEKNKGVCGLLVD